MFSNFYGTYVRYPYAGYYLTVSAYVRLTPRARAAIVAAIAGVRAPTVTAAYAAATKRLARLPLTVGASAVGVRAPTVRVTASGRLTRRVRYPAKYLATLVTAVPYTRPSAYTAGLTPNVTRYALR